MSYAATAAAARYAASPQSATPIAQYVEAVWQDTWDHLAPKARSVYTGFVLFTLGIHGDIAVIDWSFALEDRTELDGSPWFHEDLHDRVWGWIEQKNIQRGCIWRFDGTFERLKNGKSRWRGKVRPMRVVYRFQPKSQRRITNKWANRQLRIPSSARAQKEPGLSVGAFSVARPVSACPMP